MNMKMRGLSFFLAIVLAVYTAGCASMQGHEGAAVGAGAGAATGAVAGALIGKGAGAVVVGSLLGALAGGAIGHYAYDQKKHGNRPPRTTITGIHRGWYSASKMFPSLQRIFRREGKCNSA